MSLAARLTAKDLSLWPADSAASRRLGWLDAPQSMADSASELMAWAATVDSSHIVVVGMGGSSLGPEVLRAASGSDRLIVLDTTDPATVLSTPLGDTTFVISSKSGGTLEVQALLAHCWERLPDPTRYVAVTDPGTELESLANERGFSRIFVNDPDIGGRYSVLSYFGLVPAALLGIDVEALCASAANVDMEEAVSLGLAVADAAQSGQDKLTIVTPAPYSAFGLWIEQLVAESTGKSGKGVIPVPTTEVEVGSDRFPVAIEIGAVEDLGREFFRWEVATAVMGHRLDIDPFDEPNVTESKENTAKVLESLPLPEVPVADPSRMGPWLREVVNPGDYVSVQAYLPYGQDDELERLRVTLRDGLAGAAVTAGYGPRFLHSTGQLHKGGPDSVVAIQIVPPHPTADLAVPGFGYDFGTLIAAQALGDLQSLQAHGRRVLRVTASSIGELL